MQIICVVAGRWRDLPAADAALYYITAKSGPQPGLFVLNAKLRTTLSRPLSPLLTRVYPHTLQITPPPVAIVCVRKLNPLQSTLQRGPLIPVSACQPSILTTASASQPVSNLKKPARTFDLDLHNPSTKAHHVNERAGRAQQPLPAV